MAVWNTLRTQLHLAENIRLLRIACVTQNICLTVLSGIHRTMTCLNLNFALWNNSRWPTINHFQLVIAYCLYTFHIFLTFHVLVNAFVVFILHLEDCTNLFIYHYQLEYLLLLYIVVIRIKPLRISMLNSLES